MRLHELADFVPNEYCERLEASFPDIVDLYQKNPYILLDKDYMLGENPPISFVEIDRHTVLDTFLMRKMEMKAAIYHVLLQNEAQGNSWLGYHELKSAVMSLLWHTGHPLLSGTPFPYLMAYSDSFSYDPETESVALAETRQREWQVYHGIKHGKMAANRLRAFVPCDVTNVLSARQLASARNVVREGGNISLLTGGPGTGKTTVLKSVANGMSRCYPEEKVVFLAPTGKAAKRMKEVFGGTDMDVSTIHVFIGWGQKKKKPEAVRRKVESTRLIVIDEASMADIEALSILFSMANMDVTKIIFVGDEDQLPAVGAGDIIGDLKRLGVYHEKLTENYRSDGLISQNKERVNSGNPFLLEGEDFQIIECAPEVAKAALAAEMSAASSASSAVLTPFRSPDIRASTFELNNLVQNKRFGGIRQLGGRFCVGDRVLILHTNYKRRYYNGDTGVLAGYDAESDSYVVKLDNSDEDSEELVYVKDDADIELGYAMTIHKSQGSEYVNVDIVIPEYSPFITRKMLYTAITRAKVRVRLWTTRDILTRIILTEEPPRRTMVSLWEKQLA